MKCAKPQKIAIFLENLKSGENQIELHEIDGVKIPFISAELMLKTKQALSEKDEIDRLYLRRILGRL